jgi:N6-adenosine-specific RNA methylase IME4
MTKYEIVYADPPWYYGTRKTGTKFGGGVTDKYPTMSVQEICDIPVKDWVADDAMLFLWTTMPYLQKSFDVIEAWGFTYTTMAFTWVKMNKTNNSFFKGVGNWTKSNAELCLLARRGKTIPRANKDVCQVIMETRREHSRKPDRVRNDIVRLLGDRPRLEMFARTQTPGWDTWGNQTNKFKETQ